MQRSTLLPLYHTLQNTSSNATSRNCNGIHNHLETSETLDGSWSTHHDHQDFNPLIQPSMDHHDSSSIITVWYRPLSPGYESGSMPTCSILRATSIHLPTSLVFTRVPWSWSIDPYWAFSEKMLQNLMVHQPLWTQPFHPKHFPGSPAEFPRFVELRSGVDMGFSEGSAQPPEALRQAGHLLAQLRKGFFLPWDALRIFKLQIL